MFIVDDKCSCGVQYIEEGNDVKIVGIKMNKEGVMVRRGVELLTTIKQLCMEILGVCGCMIWRRRGMLIRGG